MKSISYTRSAYVDLRTYRSEERRIVAKIERYARTGSGDVTQLVGRPCFRLRVGDFRVIFEESETEIVVIGIGPRGSIYD